MAREKGTKITRVQRLKPLQVRAVDNLHVDGELLTVVVENEDTDAATTRVEGALETAGEIGLVDEAETLLDVTGLGHGNDEAILEIENAVLLEDGAEHGLDDDAGGRVGDEGRLLVQLLGEEVDTKVAILAGGGGGGDADNLAGTALEHQEVAQANVVAGDGDSVGCKGVGRVARARARTRRLLVDVHINVVVVLLATGVSDAVVLVVVTHLGFLLGDREASRFDGLVRDNLDAFLERSFGRNARVNGVFVDVDARRLVARTSRCVYGGVVLSGKALTVLTLGKVNGACEGFGNVNSDVRVRLCEFGARCGRTARFVDVMLVTMDTGTVVTFLFASITDLFFAVAVLSSRGNFSVDRDRRVLTFPSGFAGRFDLELLTSLDGLRLHLAVPVGRWEDTEGDRDSSFKIQVGDFC
jgi:hypothetical protein